MKAFEPIDNEPPETTTPIENYPGYLGVIWDGKFVGPASEGISRLENIDWNHYWDLIFDTEDVPARRLKLEGVAEVSFDPSIDLAYLIDQLPAIDVQFDDGSSYDNPAAGAGYIFFVKDGYSEEEAERQLALLANAVERDIAELEASNLDAD